MCGSLGTVALSASPHIRFMGPAQILCSPKTSRLALLLSSKSARVRAVSSDRPVPKTDDATLIQPTDAARRSFGEAYERLVGLMARLRGENGCPWDRAQDLKTLRPYLIEEAYEVLEALESGTVAEHKEELGDLLLQVVFHAEIRRQEGAFDAADVAHAIADKLVRRHPHVFGDQKEQHADAALKRWEEIKSKEKGGRSIIGGVPKELPGLLRAQRVQEKASQVGFDWKAAEPALAKVEEEARELREAIRSNDKAAIEHELGDALFALVNVARLAGVASEDALRGTIERFSSRFRHIETTIEARGGSMRETPLEEMERLWEEAKALERK
jgi:tetrapyrrole methylase family protein / MazG family protein